MGNKAVQLDKNGKTLTVDDTVYKLTSGLLELLTSKHPRPDQYNSNDKRLYSLLVAQTKVKSFPNRTDGTRPHATWKWKYMLRKMVMPGERIREEEESEETVDKGTASIGDTGESSDILLSDLLSSDIPLFPSHTRSYGKAKTTKDSEPFYKCYGVVYIPGDISGLTKKFHLLAAEFFGSNATVKNDLGHVLDALLRLKQLTRKEYADITARLAASLYKSIRFTVRRYKYGGCGIVSTIGLLLARYATKAMLATAAKTAMRGILDAAKRTVAHMIAHKVASTIADAARKRKK